MTTMTPVAIVRMAAIGAPGASLAAMVPALLAPPTALPEGAALEQRPNPAKGAGEAPIGPGQPDRAEHLLGLCLAQLRCPTHGLWQGEAPERCAMVLGTTLAGMRHCGQALRWQAKGDESRALDEFALVPAGAVMRRALGDAPAPAIAITLSCACASSLSAVAHACWLLHAGRADLAVAGGYDPISEFSYGGFTALQLVAPGAPRPFAADRDGMKVGEGCALLVLQRLEDALAQRREVIAVIEAIGESSDAHHLTLPHPEGDGAARALAVATGGHAPDLIMAHGTGTEANDAAEYRAYARTLGERLSCVRVCALKGRLGHPLGAAGALELTIALGALRAGGLPGSGGHAPDAQAFEHLRLARAADPTDAIESIAVLAAGFGGANVAASVRVGGACNDRAAPGAEAGRATHASAIQAFGAVNDWGRGAASLEACVSGAAPGSCEQVMAPLLDRARTRRLALLPRLMIAAVRDLCDTHGIAADELASVPMLAATWHGAADFTERYYRDLLASGIDLANPMLFAESVPNIGSAHLSLTFSSVAASASVVGTRTAGLEALHLASSRIASGQWSRALVVAADESHPIVDATLSHCHGTPVASRCGAVALLLARGETPAPRQELRVECAAGRWAADERCFVSASPCDDGAARASVQRIALPEMGASAAPAILALLASRGVGDGVRVACRDPYQGLWSARLWTHAASA